MKFLITIFAFCQCFSVFPTEPSPFLTDLEKYINPLISQIYKSKKIYYVSRSNLVSKNNGNRADSILLYDYGFTKEQWNIHWNACRLNFYYPCDWIKLSTQKKKRKLIESKKKAEGKIEVLSVSIPMFLTKNDYLIEITSYCKGICSYTNLYFVHYNKALKKNEIRCKINTSVS